MGWVGHVVGDETRLPCSTLGAVETAGDVRYVDNEEGASVSLAGMDGRCVRTRLGVAVALTFGCASESTVSPEPRPPEATEVAVELNLTVDEHDGRPTSNGMIELVAPDGSVLAACDLEEARTCRLRTKHRGVVTLNGPGINRIPCVLDDESVSFALTYGPPTRGPSMQWVATPESALAARTAMPFLDLANTRRAHLEGLRAAAEPGDDSDPSRLVTEFHGRMSETAQAATDPAVKTAALVAALAIWGPDQSTMGTLADAALGELEPTADAWALHSESLSNALRATSRNVDSAWQEAIERHPNAAVVANLLLHRLRVADEEGDDDAARGLFSTLKTARFEGTNAQMMADFYDPDRPLRKGKTMPPVMASALGRENHPVNWTEAMNGKVYVIEFWAKWCTGCVVAMPKVHQAYEDFHPRGLELVSVTFDDEDVLADFRKTWPMPWSHAVAGRNAQALFDQFGRKLPTVVLVDRDGTIRAVDRPWKELREQLDAILPPGENPG